MHLVRHISVAYVDAAKFSCSPRLNRLFKDGELLRFLLHAAEAPEEAAAAAATQSNMLLQKKDYK